jgi:uncharacterized membrane protein YuzA (DUF378 family)
MVIKMKKKSKLDYFTIIIMIIGALNWGLIGTFNFNLVTSIFGIGIITTIIYILVGLSGLYGIYYLTK